MTDFAPLEARPFVCHSATPDAKNTNHSHFIYGPRGAPDRSFMHANALTQRFAALPPHACFVMAEIGFGAGDHYLDIASCFLAQAPSSASLYVIATESRPLTALQLALAHQGLVQHRSLAAQLRDCYPPACPGFHLLQPHPRIHLLLLTGDTLQLLRLLDAKVDAWSINKELTTPQFPGQNTAIAIELARLSRPGATFFGSYHSQHNDRLGAALAANGFRIEAAARATTQPAPTLRGQAVGTWQPWVPPRPRVAIVGAGLAGCTTARALAEAGCHVEIFDPCGIAQGASGNLAGVIYTTPSSNLEPQNRFYQASFITALRWLKRHHWPQHADQGCLNGVIQLPCLPRLVKKQQAALTSSLWPTELLAPAKDWPTATISFPTGGYINPPSWCRYLVTHPRIQLRPRRITRLEQTPHNRWQLWGDQQALAAVDVVILANAQAAQQFVTPMLPLQVTRGQVSLVTATTASRHYQQALCHQGYFSPAIKGQHCVGASFDIHDSRCVHKPQDDIDNLALLRHWLPDVWAALGGDAIEVAGSRVGLRCQAKGYLPLAGGTSSANLLLNIAHGSRGITATPLVAELLKSRLLGLPCPVDRELTAALHPERFKHIDTIVAVSGDDALA